MSAAPPSAANATTGGLTTEKAVPGIAKPRKRVTSSRGASEATESLIENPFLATTTRTRRSRDLAKPKFTGEASGDVALSRDLRALDGEMQLETSRVEPAVQKSIFGADTEAGQLPPAVKPKTFKHSVQKGSAVGKDRPRSIWDVVGHLFSRLFLLFVIVAGLGTTLWSLKVHPHLPYSKSASEVERLEDFVTKTTKWMQVQLEVVDMKIGKEVRDLRNEVKQKVDSQIASLGTDLRSMKVQVDMLYGNGGPLNRNEALELMRTIVDRRAVESGGKTLSLDDVRAVARQIVLTELEKHSADGIGRADYALGSGGGRVVEHSEGYYLGRGEEWSVLALSLLPGTSRKHPMAKKVLEPSFGEPGQCLPLKGSNVFVEISLRTAIIPDSLTLEHVSKSVGYDVKSAPREFRVLAWRELRQPAGRVAHPTEQRLLGEFTYDVQGATVQTFPLAEEDVGGELINMVRLHVLSNHGSPLHTCLYRIRVHGLDPQASL